MLLKSNEPNLFGNIFHIIHGSFVDGYGIRTTVFLKGCPLRCVWCCNPEGQSSQPEIKLTIEKCDGCGDCIDACYTGALELFGKYMTVNEVFNEIKKDEQFYRNSGGGVTIGGGEPTLQPLFTLELIRRCKENQIHVAVDTCGYTTVDNGFKVLAEADLLLFDLKGMDAMDHTQNTGLSNECIHQNLNKLNDIGKPVIVRVPVIPGFTDMKDNLSATAEMLSGFSNIERVDLMAFHNYGDVKYTQLEMQNRMASIQPPGKEKMEEIKTMFINKRLRTQLGG